MSNLDKRWVKWIIVAVVFGWMLGTIVSNLLSVFLSDTWALLLNMFTPAFIILGLAIVLFLYQKEKDKIL